MIKAVTTHDLQKMKQEHRPIAMVTAYDYSMASLVDEAEIDLILVGDSLGNVMMGYDTTVPVTMDDMVHHTRCVTRAIKRAFVVADMPFLACNVSPEETMRNAGRLMQEGRAKAVKIEGGYAVVNMVKDLTAAGIPVMGHLGLTPQSVHQMGGYKVQGKTAEAATKLLAEAQALQEAGIFALVLECVPTELAKQVTDKLAIPTIGIGAGADCDGQVLVIHDLLGINVGFKPKFVKRYADLHGQIIGALQSYKKEVATRAFPDEEHSFAMPDQELKKLY